MIMRSYTLLVIYTGRETPPPSVPDRVDHNPCDGAETYDQSQQRESQRRQPQPAVQGPVSESRDRVHECRVVDKVDQPPECGLDRNRVNVWWLSRRLWEHSRTVAQHSGIIPVRLVPQRAISMG